MNKKVIDKKINLIIEQYKLCKFEVYIPILLQIKEKLYSKNENLKKESIKEIESLLLTFRAWDGYDNSNNPDEFINDFQNFDEWYTFLQEVVDNFKNYKE